MQRWLWSLVWLMYFDWHCWLYKNALLSLLLTGVIFNATVIMVSGVIDVFWLALSLTDCDVSATWIVVTLWQHLVIKIDVEVVMWQVAWREFSHISTRGQTEETGQWLLWAGAVQSGHLHLQSGPLSQPQHAHSSGQSGCSLHEKEMVSN